MTKRVRPREGICQILISVLQVYLLFLTVDSDITHGIGPVFLLLCLAFVCAELAGKVSDHGIALRQNLTVEFDDGDCSEGVELCDLGLFVFWVLVKVVADVLVSDASIL